MTAPSQPTSALPAGTVGFLGLGVMGQPMALNLARAGVDLVVWNRSPARVEPLRAAGARSATSVDDVFARASTVFLMLVDERVTDTVLGRGTPRFGERVAGHLLVSTGSVSPGYSRDLAADVVAHGGRFVESPVSGQRGPAEAGELVTFVGGDPTDIDEVLPLLEPMTKTAIVCGGPGRALTMKLAVNHYLNVMVAALAEATHFADAQGLDRSLFARAILAGPLASDLAAMKLGQLIDGDFEVRAAASDAHTSSRLIGDAARAAHLATPLLDLATTLYEETTQLGEERRDMIAVIDAISARTERERTDRPGAVDGSASRA